ncbi:MAG: flagellar hook-basal body complex protein [Clostridia bacterium]|nr:flagellar hook-basal body complex protein [Clostridia bacterium]
MNQSFFIGAVGAHQQLKRLNLHANNIANVNTAGFKAGKSRFGHLIYQDLKAAGEVMEPSGVGGILWTSATDHSRGGAMDTGNETDFMIAGDGYFALVELTTGAVTDTRSGAFYAAQLVEPTGEVDEEGNPLLDENGEPLTEVNYYLSDGEGRFVLNEDGALIPMVNGRFEEKPGVFDYINYDGMTHNEESRLINVEKNGGLRRGDSEILQGVLEMSNADLAEEMTKVIESQRAYSMALKMVQASDEIESTIIGLRN